ncbi:flagellar hook-length control protein FliK [Halobacillus sp. BBL2006]|uniref:flagellar hook-length control protein FliK n=1 Tax=Halobacillus sp. BBL2006 TaxID=1543706 RepID=UPI000543AF27|nr:flagellar hook-length control protein FliK [Halobacillus sp. BBL2006]KHE73294.1 hypothetical protein LD39_00040 [Halobacillus sp. BBL2006]
MPSMMQLFSARAPALSQLNLSHSPKASKNFQQLLSEFQLEGEKYSLSQNMESFLQTLQSIFDENRLDVNVQEIVREQPAGWIEGLTGKLKGMSGQELETLVTDLDAMNTVMNALLKEASIPVSQTNTKQLIHSVLQKTKELIGSKEEIDEDEKGYDIGAFHLIENVIVSRSNSTHSQPSTDESAHSLYKQLMNAWQNFKKMTSQMNAKDFIDGQQLNQKQVIEVKDLLQQFTRLLKQNPLNSTEQWRSVVSQVTNDGTERQQKVFQSLLQSFNRRVNVPETYQQQSPVSGKEVVKWLTQAIEATGKDQLSEKQAQGGSIPAQTMTKVEQYVLHINQNQSQNTMQNKWMEEFERVLYSSKLFFNKAGNMELQLKLRPANLGEMTVKLAELNGEMAVKIIVSTQASKEMLESNLAQLRHMFTPQQVVIEKNENLAAQQQFFQESESKDPGYDGEQEQHARERDDQPDDHEEDLSFHEILLNEKV